MRFFSLIVLPLLLAACMAKPVTQESYSSAAASSAQISSVTTLASSALSLPDSNPPFDKGSHSGAYVNTELGFSLKYPTHFEPLGKPLWDVYRQYNSRVVDGMLEHDKQYALFALSARDREIPSEFGMTIAVYPMDDYSYVNIYDDEYLYDTDSGTWKKVMADESYKPVTRTYNGLTMYSFAFGDAGHSERTFVVFNKDKKIAVELTTGGCIGCIRGTDGFGDLPQEEYDLLQRHADADTDLILNSFRWID